MRYFFVDRSDTVNSSVVIKGSDANHIKNVLRMKPGDTLGLFDGEGLDYEALIVNIFAGGVELSIVRSFPSTAESPVHITVAQAYLKDRKMDDLVRQVTELGVKRWVPFFAERSVPRPDEERLNSRTKRWQKIAAEALKQCKRGRVTAIGEPVTFEGALRLGRGSDLKVVFWEKASMPLDALLPPAPLQQVGKIFVLLGPEGGFTTREVDSAKASGFSIAGLGPRILRAETATLSACVLLQYLYGDMGQKNLDKATTL